MRAPILIGAAAILLFGHAAVHANKDASPKTIGIGAAVGRAGSEAARRATEMGLPRSVARSILQVAAAAQPAAERMHRESVADPHGASVKRAPGVLRSTGTPGAAHVEETPTRVSFGTVPFAGHATGPGAHPFHEVTVTADGARTTLPGGGTRTVALVKAAIPLGTGRPTIPVGSMVVSTIQPGKPWGLYAVTPDREIIRAGVWEEGKFVHALDGVR